MGGMMGKSTQVLLLSCLLSTSTHYGTFMIGPLKSHFIHDTGISSVTFASFLSALSILNTITPIVSGAYLPKLGVGRTAIAATGIALLGQTIVLLGQTTQNYRFFPTVFGLALFSCAFSPLLVIQETVVLSNVPPQSAGIYMAMGLLMNKLMSWLGGVTSVPLYERFGHLAVFLTATLLAVLSFLAALALDKLTRELEFHKTSRMPLWQTTQFGDSFQVYAILCVVAGSNWYACECALVIWGGLIIAIGAVVPLSSSLLEVVFETSASLSSFVASAILFSSVVLYLPVGFIVDRLPFNGIFWFVIMSASLTLLSLCMLWTTIVPSEFITILPYAVGYGYSPLITVLSASRIVKPDQVPLALGVHKSLEMAGATVSQQVAGWVLRSGDTKNATLSVVKFFVFVNVVQLLCALLFLHTGRHNANSDARYSALDAEPSDADVELQGVKEGSSRNVLPPDTATARVLLRGKISFYFCAGTVALAWLAFVVGIVER